MKIKNIELKNFKRFTNLIISDIPETSKLVLLIGSNGSGKSSLFDAFDWLNKGPHKGLPHDYKEYYKKNGNDESSISIELAGNRHIIKHDLSVKEGSDLIQKFLGRSGIRIVPRITNNANPDSVLHDQDSPSTYIEHDTRFVNDVFLYIQEINNALRKPVFSGVQVDVPKIFMDSIKPLNDSLLKIFGEDKATTIQIAEFQDASPHTPAKLIFKKGDSKINYDLLSHGEKQIVILLLNFIVRRKYYDDSIIFIDEMDSHLNTALQYNLIDEIVTRWIPNNAQLWTASHALGFIDYAKKSDIATTIDFDLLNFDVKQELKPISKEKLDVYEIAIPKETMTSLLDKYTIVHVENTNAKYFNLALVEDEYLFVPAHNSYEVFGIAKIDKRQLGLRDRDYLKTDEIDQLKLKFPNFKILSLYAFENYVYHPDNIAELNIENYNKEKYIKDIVEKKNKKKVEIAAEIATARQTYAELKEGFKKDDKDNIQPILDSLKSDSFDVFYPYFNMGKYYKENYFNQLGCSVHDLTKTKWFKQQILKILK